MAGTIRLNKGQLNDLIENAKANGGNSEELEGLLAEVEAEERQTRPGPPQARRRPQADLDEEEETTEEYLNNKVGYLFPGGIHGELLERIIDIDRSYLTPEIKLMCRENGLSTSKDKKVLVAKLLAHNVNLEARAPEAILPQTTTPRGTCYEDAWRFLIKEGEGKLIHGTVQSIDQRINHAWVETETGYIWEPETGEFMKRAYFDEIAKPEAEAEYTTVEAAIMGARTRNLGPWTKEERRLFLKEER